MLALVPVSWEITSKPRDIQHNNRLPLPGGFGPHQIVYANYMIYGGCFGPPIIRGERLTKVSHKGGQPCIWPSPSKTSKAQLNCLSSHHDYCHSHAVTVRSQWCPLTPLEEDMCELHTWSLQDSATDAFSIANFSLYSFTVMNSNCEHDPASQ